MPKILLAEDDVNLREIFEMRLKAEGYDVLTAGDGEEALVVATKEKPDLAVIDIMMPKISGFEMLETLRAQPETANIKAMMMTALGQDEDRDRGQRLGVLKYLVKSQVTLEDFIRSVKEILSPNQDNKKGNNMDDHTSPSTDNSNLNAPSADNGSSDAAMPAAPAATPAPEPANLPSDEPTTDQEKQAVDQQVNNFATQPVPADDSAATQAPAMDTPAVDTPAPAAEPASPVTAPAEPTASTPTTEPTTPPVDPASGMTPGQTISPQEPSTDQPQV